MHLLLSLTCLRLKISGRLAIMSNSKKYAEIKSKEAIILFGMNWKRGDFQVFVAGFFAVSGMAPRSPVLSRPPDSRCEND